MNDEPCVLSVNNTEYYVACNSIDYIVLVGNDLINTSSSSITLYHDYPQLNDSYSGYPRIQASANQKFYYRGSYNSQNVSLNVTQFSVVNRHTSYDFLLSLVIIFCLIINLFKR